MIRKKNGQEGEKWQSRGTDNIRKLTKVTNDGHKGNEEIGHKKIINLKSVKTIIKNKK